mgnify:CR=1 FL=1
MTQTMTEKKQSKETVSWLYLGRVVAVKNVRQRKKTKNCEEAPRPRGLMSSKCWRTSRQMTCILRWTGRSRCCCARLMYYMTTRFPSSVRNWIWYQEWAPIFGLNRPASVRLTFCAPTFAAPVMVRCAVW